MDSAKHDTDSHFFSHAPTQTYACAHTWTHTRTHTHTRTTSCIPHLTIQTVVSIRAGLGAEHAPPPRRARAPSGYVIAVCPVLTPTLTLTSGAVGGVRTTCKTANHNTPSLAPRLAYPIIHKGAENLRK